MYYSKKKTHNSLEGINLIDIDGFLIRSKKGLTVENQVINNIKVVNTSLANFPIEYELMKRYEKLKQSLVELLSDDDDSGNSCREALNQIERFRLEVKNKYRDYVDKKTLENISIVLKKMKKTAEQRLIEINYVMDLQNGKSR